MFLRHTIRRKDGKSHRYWSVVENRRLRGGGTAQKTLLCLCEINDSQLLVIGLLRRLTRVCRKVTDIKLIELLRTSLLAVRIDPHYAAIGQIRFCSSE